MKNIAIYSLILLVLLSCENKVKVTHPNPVGLLYTEIVKENDDEKVVRKFYFSLDSVITDTIHKIPHTLQIPTREKNYYPVDRVDLNDIFGNEDDSTDWNYTEIDEDDWKYLESIGIYWDVKHNCFRKK